MARPFLGVRFALFGFDPDKHHQVNATLVSAGGEDVGEIGPDCTHVIVDRLVYDDPVCVAARNDGKTLVNSLWVDHSLKVDAPVDASHIMYRPVKDLNGIPGAKVFVLCLTGYQQNEREDIMTLVTLMGAHFSKPLVANKVTHLICYKFEGEKYELAKRTRRIKLVNHRWLEDCLKEWEMLPEEKYCKSGYELEMEAEAKDSYDEAPDFDASLVSGSLYDLHNKLPVSQNPSVMKGMLQNTFPNIGNKKDVTLPIKPELKSDQRNWPYDAVDMLDARCQNVGVGTAKSDDLLDQHVAAPVLSSVTSEGPCSSSSAKKLPHDSADKLYALSYSRKTPRTTRLSLEQASPLNGCGSEGKYCPRACTATCRDDCGKGIMNYTSLAASSDGTVLADESGQNPFMGPKRKSDDGTDLSPPNSKAQKLNPLPNKTTDAREPRGLLNGSFEMRKSISVVDPPVVPVTHGFGQLASSDPEKRSPGNSMLTSRSLRSSLHAGGDSDEGCGNSRSSAAPATSIIKAKEESLDQRKDQNPFASSSGKNPEIMKSKTENPVLNATHVQDLSLQRPTRKTSAKKRLGSKTRFHTSDLGIQKDSVCLTGMSPRENASSLPVPEVAAVDHYKVETVTAHDDANSVAHLPVNDVVKTARSKIESSEALLEPEKLGSQGKSRPAEHTRITSEGQKMDQEAEVHAAAADGNSKVSTENEDRVRVCNEKPRPCSSVYQRDPRRKKLAEGRNLISVEIEKHRPASVKVPEPDSSAFVKKVEVKRNSETRGVGKRVLDALYNMSPCTTSVKKLNPIVGKENDDNLAVCNDRNVAKDKKEKGKTKDESRKTAKESTEGASNVDRAMHGGHKSDAVKRDPSWFIVSGHRLQRKEFQQVIKKLKGRLCRDDHKWSYQATHFIVLDPIRRTEKFFAALASGSWVLKPDFLSASHEAGKFLPEEPYEWHKNGLSADGAINLEAPRKWRLMRERTRHGAFYGVCIVIYGDCIAPSLDTMKRVIKTGGGTILATSPPYTRFLKSELDFAIVSPGMPQVNTWIQEFLRAKIPCVLADYLVDYVCKPGYPLEKHVLYNTQNWAARSFARLVSCSEVTVEIPGSPNKQVSDRKKAGD